MRQLLIQEDNSKNMKHSSFNFGKNLILYFLFENNV